MLRGIPEEMRVELRDVRDPFPVGRPGGLIIRAGIGGDLREMCALIGSVCRNDPNIGVTRGVRIGRAAVAGEGELLAVRRPRGLRVVEVPGSNLRDRFLLDAEDVEVRAPIVEVTDGVLLELKAVNHPRRLRFWFCESRLVFIFFLFFVAFYVLRLGILNNKYQARAIG